MALEKLFLIIFGLLLAISRFIGIVSPETFKNLVNHLWKPDIFKFWGRIWAIFLILLGFILSFLFLKIFTVAGIVSLILSIFLIIIGLILLFKKSMLDNLISKIFSDNSIIRIFSILKFIIGLLLICLGIS